MRYEMGKRLSQVFHYNNKFMRVQKQNRIDSESVSNERETKYKRTNTHRKIPRRKSMEGKKEEKK